MNNLLFNRSAGLGSAATAREYFLSNQFLDLAVSETRLESLSPRHQQNVGSGPTYAPGRGRGAGRYGHEDGPGHGVARRLGPAHTGGVNAIEIDRFEGRYLLSGGADSTVRVWDLEAASLSDDTHGDEQRVLRPLGSIAHAAKSHKFGITDISWYPFDSCAFLTSSFDATLKINDALALQPKASFTLESAIYSHAMSPIADHLLVACATQHPAIRLVDLRSNAAIQALVGHTGAVLSVAWSPVSSNIVASGSTDGTIRLWDIRRSAGQLGILDMDDSIGSLESARSQPRRSTGHSKAHTATVNGLLWTEDGRHLISNGHDEQIRLWDMLTKANTLTNFGPLVKNKALSRVTPCLAPASFTAAGMQMLFFPADREILMYDLFEGCLKKRFRVPGPPHEPSAKEKRSPRILKALAWRAFNVELYSAQTDGNIYVWQPLVNDEDGTESMVDERAKKREVLDDIYQDIIKRSRSET